ncbi:MAG: VOC family protein [Alphaproteobacteria bacterium]|nr:VOC family protein [Alphaproteobacteria bacterium]
MRVNLQPLICVQDVEHSSRWYQRLLGFESGHGGTHYERLMLDGVLVMQLHQWDVEHQHGRLGDPDDRPYGNGCLLWFELDDFEEAVTRAKIMRADIIKPRHRSENAHYECWLRDPDGYTVVLAGRQGSAI